MGADLSPADPGDDRLDLRQFHQLPLDPHGDLRTLGQSDRRRHRQTEDQRPFLEGRSEFRPQPGNDRHTDDQQDDGQQHCGRPFFDEEPDEGFVRSIESGDDPVTEGDLFGLWTPHQQPRHDGRNQQGVDQ